LEDSWRVDILINRQQFETLGRLVLEGSSWGGGRLPAVANVDELSAV